MEGGFVCWLNFDEFLPSGIRCALIKGEEGLIEGVAVPLEGLVLNFGKETRCLLVAALTDKTFLYSGKEYPLYFASQPPE